MKNIIFPDCEKAPRKLEIPKMEGRIASVYRMQTPVDINKLLDQYKVPVGISYCSRMLSNPTYQGLLPPQKGNPIPLKGDCAGHASLIVGKKKIGGQCHFLLRNSWGSGFGRSTQNYKCLCKKIRTGEFVDDCHYTTHNDGQYTVDSCWIPSRMTALNVYRTSILK